MFERQTHTHRASAIHILHEFKIWFVIYNFYFNFFPLRFRVKYEPDSTLMCAFVFSCGFLMQDRKYTNPKPAGKPRGSACVSSPKLSWRPQTMQKKFKNTSYIPPHDLKFICRLQDYMYCSLFRTRWLACVKSISMHTVVKAREIDT